ncbi:MAG: hypothetical protein JKY22_06120 [Flavobacteriaceae bacterium]|nr:hypothetical protein [Flavobacteriaceae bacterium]
MKTLQRFFLFLIITSFLASCTPQEILTENSDSTNVDVFATGDGDNAGVDNDRGDG